MLVAAVSFSYVAGTDITLEFTVTDEDDEVATILGSTIHFAMAKVGEDPAISTAGGTAAGSITDAPGGKFQVSIDAADTEGLFGTYRFQAQLEDASGDIATVARGFMTFSKNLLAPVS